MAEKRLPLEEQQLLDLIQGIPTPFHLYDEKAIRANARLLKEAFAWVDSFTNYFAVKACPNPTVMQILREEGFGVDCSSLPEIELALRCGFRGEEIMFSSNDTPDEEFFSATAAQAIINLDDQSHIGILQQLVAWPELISFRYNPGPERTGNVIIGNPVEAKYGVTTEQLPHCYRKAKELGSKRFALHTMVASNELDRSYIVETARMLFQQVIRLYREFGIRIEFINLGGGVGIPYRPEEEAIDLVKLSREIKGLYDEMIAKSELDPLRIVFECGRMVTGPYGYLISRVRHVAEKYKRYVGLDASMADLMRPALYGAYHHISALGKGSIAPSEIYDVTGSLCENNDKFAIDRLLPPLERDDVLVIHDTGAHGYAMGFNYNGKLRAAEYLLRSDNSLEMIRRAETMDDYFATLDF